MNKFSFLSGKKYSDYFRPESVNRTIHSLAMPVQVK